MSNDGREHSNTETDLFSRLMFNSGHSNRSDINKITDSQEIEEEQIQSAIQRNHQNDWLFGARTLDRERMHKEEEPESATLFNHKLLDNINIGELMENIDILIHSTDQLKPLYKKVTPIINQFLKK
ncbi:hypothetical protein ACFYKT_08330 [Cytobacillus sp. FJAT-53684]|uniref:Uncharacterized protein n=1 Tax=Cytobacillus mangrovibacter TaxID=3299024 RepID=A0ABW6JWY8_9BACI